MLSLNDVDLFVFDFDGVMTDNSFCLNENGEESVRLSRSDGLAISILHKLNKEMLILSSESNPVVSIRAKKLLLEVKQGSTDKKKTLDNYCYKKNISLDRVIYIGNDLNDYFAIKSCRFSACPYDSHKKIKDIVTYNLSTRGGYGVIRDLIENVFEIDLVKILEEN